VCLRTITCSELGAGRRRSSVRAAASKVWSRIEAASGGGGRAEERAGCSAPGQPAATPYKGTTPTGGDGNQKHGARGERC
jgi:hypothetical protein